MPFWIALLRGINILGRKQVRMDELKRSCESAGLEDVRTYLQSGNVVFRARGRPTPDALAARISALIARDFGHEVKTLVLPDRALGDLARSNPLRRRHPGEDNLFHVTFLAAPVPRARFAALELPRQPGEEALLAGRRTVLLYCPHGYGRTKLNNTYFEKKLGVSATTRNWRTVLALREMCG